ncbi:hypothetical protein ZIOFF_049219 [Zingiber officinale]|uniref:Protein preY, mitochondrial n=1 Tax=Zingiber officinale TaxID=94328 RepID=A0A8J5G8X6_ZINOF|nr:hypothetical protein ZIOFF_049219 [Zingiber officinale]
MARGVFSLLFRTGIGSGSGGGGGNGDVFGKLLSDILVCPLSRQALRYCPDSQSLISDSIGVSFPVCLDFPSPGNSHSTDIHLLAELWRKIINGIPCLVPKDGKILEDQIKSMGNDDSSGADSGI